MQAIDTLIIYITIYINNLSIFDAGL